MQLKIGGQLVDVVEFEGKYSQLLGFSNSTKSEIGISDEGSDTQRDSTMLHEIIEFINSTNELGLSHPTICVLESSLYQVMVDNYGVKFIKPEIKELPLDTKH